MDNQIATGQGRSWARGQDAAGSLPFPHPSPFFSFPLSVSVSSASFPTQIASPHFVENKTTLNSRVPTRRAVTVSPSSSFKKITAEKELVGHVWVRSSCLLNELILESESCDNDLPLGTAWLYGVERGAQPWKK